MTTTINASTTAGLVQTADTSGSLQLQTANTAALTIDTSQNITTTGNIRLNNSAADGAQVILASSGYSDWNIDNYSGNLRAYYNTTEAMRIDSSGNVLVGGTTQLGSAKITNYGRFWTGSGNSSNDSEIAFSNYASATAGWTIAIRQDIGGANNDLKYVRLNSSGTYQDVPMQITQAAGYLLLGYTSSNGAYRLQVNSQIFATSATIATSDARYKTNIEPITNALSLVTKLNPVSFDWKKHPIHEFPEGKTVGFLAQEVEEVLKDTDYVHNIVKSNECTITPEVKDEEGNITQEAVTEEFLGIAEGNLIPLLTKAIQELSAKVDAQQQEINALKGVK